MMGATAIATDTVDQNIAAHSSQATAFQFVEPNYLHAPYGIPSGAGSSNDFLNAPLFSGDGGPKTPPDSGGVSISQDEPMLRLALTRRQGKSSKTSEPLEARKRLNKKNHQQHHT